MTNFQMGAKLTEGKILMFKPKLFTFNFEFNSYIGSFVAFRYSGADNFCDVWEELETYISVECPNLFRLEESSYKFTLPQQDIRDTLINLGFVEG